MKIHDILEAQLEEGPNDPNIFKAVFLAGGPGSGKSFVAKKMLAGTGLKSVNSDEVYEYLASKHDFDLGDPDQVASQQGQEMRDRAKELTKKRENLYLHGRLGLVIDGTGKDVAKVTNTKNALQELGYDTMMIFVNTNEDVAQERNLKRARSIPSSMVSSMWKAVQDNIMKFQQIFGASNFHVVDNSGGLEDPERAENFKNVISSITSFLQSPPKRRAALKWLRGNKQ